MEDILEKKYEMVLEKCMERKMPLNTVFYVANSSALPNAMKIVDKMLEIVETASEYDLRLIISDAINEIADKKKQK